MSDTPKEGLTTEIMLNSRLSEAIKRYLKRFSQLKKSLLS